jgi:protein SCO1/2
MMPLALLLLLLSRPALAFDPVAQAGIDPPADARAPMALGFREADGSPITLARLAAGRPLVLVPVQHHCPNICGVTLAGVASAIAAQPLRAGRDFTVVAFGIDPKEGPADAQASLAALRGRVPAIAGIHALTGAAPDIAAVTAALGYRYAWDPAIGQFAHVAATAVLMPDGRLSRWLYGLAPDPLDLRLAVTEAGQGRIGGLGDRLLLLCYHYDPVTGRYAATIRTLLRAGGAATVALLAGFIMLATIRERRT